MTKTEMTTELNRLREELRIYREVSKQREAEAVGKIRDLEQKCSSAKSSEYDALRRAKIAEGRLEKLLDKHIGYEGR
jgi:uncharacterized protein involved in exopolysaccharide biosynthesis